MIAEGFAETLKNTCIAVDELKLQIIFFTGTKGVSVSLSFHLFPLWRPSLVIEACCSRAASEVGGGDGLWVRGQHPGHGLHSRRFGPDPSVMLVKSRLLCFTIFVGRIEFIVLLCLSD